MKVFIIVEWKIDTTKLKNIFPKIKTIEINSREITREKLTFIKKFSLNNKMIIFIDSDYLDQKFRQNISYYLHNNYLNSFIAKKYSIKSKKWYGWNICVCN